MVAALVSLALLRTVGSSRQVGCACTGQTDALGHGSSCRIWPSDGPGIKHPQAWCYVQKPPICPSAEQMDYGEKWWWTSDCSSNKVRTKASHRVTTTVQITAKLHPAEHIRLVKTLTPEGGCQCDKQIKDPTTGSAGYCRKWMASPRPWCYVSPRNCKKKNFLKRSASGLAYVNCITINEARVVKPQSKLHQTGRSMEYVLPPTEGGFILSNAPTPAAISGVTDGKSPKGHSYWLKSSSAATWQRYKILPTMQPTAATAVPTRMPTPVPTTSPTNVPTNAECICSGMKDETGAGAFCYRWYHDAGPWCFVDDTCGFAKKTLADPQKLWASCKSGRVQTRPNAKTTVDTPHACDCDLSQGLACHHRRKLMQADVSDKHRPWCYLHPETSTPCLVGHSLPNGKKWKYCTAQDYKQADRLRQAHQTKTRVPARASSFELSAAFAKIAELNRDIPSTGPTHRPSQYPTSSPTPGITEKPSASPSASPTFAPTNPTQAPSAAPTARPCDTLVIAKSSTCVSCAEIPEQRTREGFYKVVTMTSFGRRVYRSAHSKHGYVNFLYWYAPNQPGRWVIGPTPAAPTGGMYTLDQAFFPEQIKGRWMVYTGLHAKPWARADVHAACIKEGG